MTPCGMTVCTGCATCVKAWSQVVGLRLAPWQRALVDRIYPPAAPPIQRLLARRPELASTPNLGVALHAIALESA